MPSPNSHRRGRLSVERPSSCHGHNAMAPTPLRRPKTDPDLLSYRNHAGSPPEGLPRQPPKLLLKVTVLGSLGPVQVLMRPESTVGELVAAVARQYVKEARRPILPTNDASDFDLHYSQFSLESLHREEKLVELGSRNFFMCPRKKLAATTPAAVEGGGVTLTTAFASCAKEAGKGSGRDGGGFGWLKLLRFML
ncbi:uncharacterized protein At4g22758-like [Lotus japonicus]|uniref:uncharacterized protein At4g22758-like n=1 Tax=Lotus japonicus TaxID=34305 RepID=UPI00258C21CC|nr:uncharacterized protein At4g22758-like [Lotus japonicus]